MGGGPITIKQDSTTSVTQSSGSFSDGRVKLIYARFGVFQRSDLNEEEEVKGVIGIYEAKNGNELHEASFIWIAEHLLQPAQLEILKKVESGVPTLIDLSNFKSESAVKSFRLPLKTIYSILSQGPSNPSSRDGSINLYGYSSTEYPTLYFHENPSQMNSQNSSNNVEWGGAQLLKAIQIYTRVLRSTLEPSLYLINPTKEDLLVHSTILFSDEDGLEAPRPTVYNEILYPDQPASVDNLAFSVLSGFSKLTRSVQSVAQIVLSHPLSKPLLSSLPPPLPQFSNVQAESPQRPIIRLQGVEFDSARIYLANWAKTVALEGIRNKKVDRERGETFEEELIGLESLREKYGLSLGKSSRAVGAAIVLSEWRSWFDEEGRLLLSEGEAKRRIFQRGLEEEVRCLGWPFLLKVYPWDSNAEERSCMQQAHQIQYETMKNTKWFQNEVVRASTTYAEESHRIEIDCLRTDRTHPLFESDNLDPSLLPSSHSTSNPHIRAMQNILLTYTFSSHGIDAGINERNYVQGMSDLLSPIYVVASSAEGGGEAQAFWAFSELMQRQKNNFRRDQVGMTTQLKDLELLIKLMDPKLYEFFEKTNSLNLFFCFRWFLCSFKRELSFGATERLWEVLWTDNYGKNFHLFLALAILEDHREVMMKYLRGFDEILKYVNELSGTLDIDSLLCSAEILYLTFQKVVKASDEQFAIKRKEEEAKQKLEASRRRKNDVLELDSEERSVPEKEIEDRLRKLLR